MDIARIRRFSATNRIFACNVLLKLFTNDELTDPQTNVYGRHPNGMINRDMKALDPYIMDQLQDIVFGYLEGNQDTRYSQWQQIRQALNKKVHELKKNRAVTDLAIAAADAESPVECN